MPGFLPLKRKTSPPVAQDCSFDKLSNHLGDYNIPDLCHLLVKHYSKLDAVSKHTDDMQLSLARALLTDCGLLFAQTRERGYPIEYSRSQIDVTADYPIIPKGLESSTLKIDNSSMKLLHETAKRSWESYVSDSSDLEVEKEPTPNFWSMVNAVLSTCRSLEHFANKLYQPGEDPGYVTALQPNECTDWIAEVKLFLPGRTEPVQAEGWLKKQCGGNISVKELFVFLAYALPRMVNRATSIVKLARLKNAKSRKPEPMISNQQVKALEQQIKATQDAKSIEHWERAGSFLREYYLPSVQEINSEGDKPLDSKFDSVCDDFSETFANYYSEMGISDKRDNTELYNDLSKFICQASCSDEQDRMPLLCNPLAIYRLVRSPFSRTRIAGCHNLDVQFAFSSIGFPIFKECLDMEYQLYNGIVDGCAESCKKSRDSFDEDSWRELWECVEESIKCLSYGYDDLFSPAILFKSAYPQFHSFFQVFDSWMRTILTKPKQPFVAALWRAIINSCLENVKWPVTMKRYTQSVNTYRKLFTSTTPDFDKLKSLLNSLAGGFQWNRVRAVPSPEELAQAYENSHTPHAKLDNEQYQLFSDLIRKALNRDAEIEHSGEAPQKEIRMILTEWILLNQICYQTQFDLFKAIDGAFTRASGASST